MKIQDKSRSKELLSCEGVNCQGPASGKKGMCQVDNWSSYRQTGFSVFKRGFKFSSALVGSGILCVVCLAFGLICDGVWVWCCFWFFMCMIWL